MSASGTDNRDDTPVLGTPGAWTLPASILAGSMIVSLFMSAFVIVSLGALVWLIAIHRWRRRQLIESLEFNSDLRGELSSVRELVRLLGSVIDAADVPIVSTDEEGVIVQANGAAQSILGSGRTLIGDYFDGLITQREVQELERLGRGGESGHARLDLPVKGSMRVFDVAVDPIVTTGGAVCTFTDITELMQSVELKADFAANASHELRTPIASIKGAIETLGGAAKDDPVMRDKLIAMIGSNATRLDLMVKDLLDLSKLESDRVPTTLSVIDAHAFVNRVCVPFAPVCARRGLEIRTEIDERAVLIETDPVLLELILRNLVENATKFARDGSVVRVTIERQRVGMDREAPPPAGLTHRDGISLRVKDKGIGIPLAHQSRIFERFYQVDEARSGSSAKRGTGLGLAIVKHAARTLGGSVNIESVHGQGTTMVVNLPGCVPEDQVREGTGGSVDAVGDRAAETG